MCAENEYARIVTKMASGVPTVPVSASHNNGDWLDTDIYEGELYIDSDTGKLYTRTASGIIDTGIVGSVNIYNSDGSLPTGDTRTFDLDTGNLKLLNGKLYLNTTGVTGGLFQMEIDTSGSGLYLEGSGSGTLLALLPGTGVGITISGTNTGIVSSTPKNGVQTTGSIPTEASSVWEVNSTTQGSRPVPRMTESERDAISSPADYLEVVNLDKERKEFFHPTDGFMPVGGYPNTMTCLDEGDNEFVILASIIGRAGGTFANGTPIDWEVLDMSDNHGRSFFTSVSGNVTTKRLEITYPTVKSVLDFDINPDETISGYGVTMQGSSGVNLADVSTMINHSGYIFLIGNGTTTWTESGGTSSQVTESAFSTTDGYTLVTFGSSFSHTENAGVSVVYQGANNYRIERSFAGGASNTAIRFRMIDIATNTPVLTAPTASDYISITGVGKYRGSINMSEYSTAVLTNNQMLNANNFWCKGRFEVWMKAMAISTTSMYIKWQAKSGVTSYKLYQDTLSDLSTKVLIYDGTNLEHVESALTANTMYYYQLCDQSDVEITQFRCRTKI